MHEYQAKMRLFFFSDQLLISLSCAYNIIYLIFGGAEVERVHIIEWFVLEETLKAIYFQLPLAAGRDTSHQPSCPKPYPTQP